jgi:hypothetical protein
VVGLTVLQTLLVQVEMDLLQRIHPPKIAEDLQTQEALPQHLILIMGPQLVVVLLLKLVVKIVIQMALYLPLTLILKQIQQVKR